MTVVRGRGFAIGLGLLALVVAGPATLISRLHGFDGLYGQDAFAYADYGLGPLRAALIAGHSPPDFPLPPGYPLLVALASLALGTSSAVAQGVCLLAGASIPVLVALVAREVLPDRDTRPALLAGLVAAVAGQLWQSSLVAMSDTPATAAATLGAWAACRFHRTGSRRWLALAAAALALAVETRLVLVTVAVVFAALVVARLRADVRREPGRVIAGGAAAAGVALLVGGPALVAIAGAVTGGRPIPFVAELGVAAFDPLTPLRSTFETADGHLSYRWPMLAWYALQAGHWYWFGAVGLAVPIGLAAVLRRPAGPTFSAAGIATVVAWPVLVLAVLVFYPYQNPRFFLAAVPPVVILAAVGLDAAWRAIRERLPAAAPLALAAITFALGGGAGLAWRYADGFVSRQAADLAAVRSLEVRVPVGAHLASIGASPALRHDGRTVAELYDMPVAVARNLLAAGPLFILVDAPSMTVQWAGTPTADAFEVIASAPGFEVVARSGAWTLFAVGR